MLFKLLAALFFAVIISLNLVGCGTTGTSQSAESGANTPEAVSKLVVSRAQQRWDALLKADMDVAYQFLSPGGRSLMTAQQYRPRVNTGFWRGAKVEKASCAAETCEVTVLVDMLVEGVKFTNPVKETWILDAGKWWFVYQG
jgi:uncharacterized protein YceK